MKKINTLAEKIKFYRKKNNLSQELLAYKMNVSQSTIAKWESGEQQPRSKNIKLLAQVLNTTSLELLNEDNGNSDNFHATAGTQTMTLRQNGKEVTLPYDKKTYLKLIKDFFSDKEFSISDFENKNSGISIQQANVGRDAIISNVKS